MQQTFNFFQWLKVCIIAVKVCNTFFNTFNLLSSFINEELNQFLSTGTMLEIVE